MTVRLQFVYITHLYSLSLSSKLRVCPNSVFFSSLTKFIGKRSNLYNNKLVTLNIPFNTFFVLFFGGGGKYHYVFILT